MGGLGEKNMKYYLVSPGETENEKVRPYYWSTDNGDKWIGIARGIWRTKHAADLITEVAEAEDLTELDWKKTPFRNDGLASGWLCRCGKFFGCPSCYHDIIAAVVIGIKVPELEKKGWVRIHDKGRIACDHRLSEEQKNWLSEHGHKVLDWY